MPNPFAVIGPTILSALGAPAAISVRQYAAGSYSSSTGRWVAGTPTDVSLEAVVQPSTPKEVEQLPENERTKEAVTIFTLAALNTSDVASSGESDVVTWASREYRVSVVEDWTTQASYAKAIAVREEE